MSIPRSGRVFATHHLPVILWAGLLALLLLTSVDGVTPLPVGVGWLFELSGFWMDIAGHLLCFTVMGWLLVRSLGALGVERVVMMSIAVASLYGVVLELGQIPIPGRGFQTLDLVTNTFGAALGAWLQISFSARKTTGIRS